MQRELLQNAVDRGTYKEDYPWSQEQLDGTIGRIMADCGHAFVTVRVASCRLSLLHKEHNRYPAGDAREFDGSMGRMYHFENPNGDMKKSCRFRLV